jgi:transmembrane sensor
MNAQIRDVAAQWLVEFRTGSPSVGARRQFAAWLRTSPEHIRAYLDALALWEDARCYDRQRRLDVDGLVARARTDHKITNLRPDDDPDNIADTPGFENQDLHSSVSRKITRRGRLGLHTAIAVLLSLLINGAVTWYATDSQGVAYVTQTAEQRSVPLADGSRVDLDALSNVRENFTSHERGVELQSGQALFRVTKDKLRPFVVRINDVRVRAVGTEFNVNRTALGTVVTVLEGRVAVFVGGSSAEAAGVAVDAGQQTKVMGSTIAVPRTVDTKVATGWTRGVLSFAATPLAEAAEEFNRSNSRRLVVASRELSDFHVTGTFRASSPESLADFVLFLRKQPGIEVLEKDDQITVRTRSTH